MINSFEEILALIIAALLALSLVGGASSSTQPVSGENRASGSQPWQQVDHYAKRLEQKAIRAERYFE